MNFQPTEFLVSSTLASLQLSVPHGEALLDGLLEHAKVHVLAAKSVLFNEGELTGNLVWLRSGLIKLQMHLPNGRTRIVRLCSAGQLIGLEGLLSRHHLFSAVVLFDAEVVMVSGADLQHWRNRDTQRYIELLEYACFTLAETEKWNAALSTGTIRARVARLLRFLAQVEQHPSHHCVILMTCEDMSSLLGVTPESVSRVLASFKRQGLLWPSSQGGRACFHCDMPRLDLIAQDEAVHHA